MENKKLFALCYLNKSSQMRDSKYWQIANVYEHYPTKEELSKTSLLGTGKDYDNSLIDIIADPNKRIARLVYSKNKHDWCEKFFEVSILEFDYGQDLNMSGYLITGYCDMFSDDHIVINSTND